MKKETILQIRALLDDCPVICNPKETIFEFGSALAGYKVGEIEKIVGPYSVVIAVKNNTHLNIIIS